LPAKLSKFRNFVTRSETFKASVIAREEDYNPTDDVNLRTYYVEWGRLMNRAASAPFEGDRR
jgi:hypothetical protein